MRCEARGQGAGGRAGRYTSGRWCAVFMFAFTVSLQRPAPPRDSGAEIGAFRNTWPGVPAPGAGRRGSGSAITWQEVREGSTLTFGPWPRLISSPCRLSSVCLSTSRRRAAGKQPIGSSTRRGAGSRSRGGWVWAWGPPVSAARALEGLRGCAPRPCPQPHPTDGNKGPRDGDGTSSGTQASCLLGDSEPRGLGSGVPVPLCPNLAHLTHSSGPGLWSRQRRRRPGPRRSASAANATSFLQGTGLHLPEASEETRTQAQERDAGEPGPPSVRCVGAAPQHAGPGSAPPASLRSAHPKPPRSPAPLPTRARDGPARGEHGGGDLSLQPKAQGLPAPPPPHRGAPPNP